MSKLFLTPPRIPFFFPDLPSIPSWCTSCASPCHPTVKRLQLHRCNCSFFKRLTDSLSPVRSHPTVCKLFIVIRTRAFRHPGVCCNTFTRTSPSFLHAFSSVMLQSTALHESGRSQRPENLPRQSSTAKRPYHRTSRTNQSPSRHGK